MAFNIRLNFVVIAGVLLSSSLACSCSEFSEKVISSNQLPTEVNDDVKMVANASNQFSIDLFQRLRGKPGNLFYSPASLATALAMAQAGAENITLQEMKKVLHASEDDNQWFASSGELSRMLNAQGDGYQIIV